MPSPGAARAPQTLWADPWIQLFAFVALASGALTARPFLVARLKRAEPAPVPAPASTPMPIAPSGPGVSSVVKAKNPGHWVVDLKGAPDSDGASLAEVLLSAKDGDIVSVRPGIYRGSVVVAASVSVIGTGARREDARLESNAPVGVVVAAGKVLFKNLTVANTGSQNATALGIDKAEVKLEDVAVKSAGQGVRIVRGTLSAVRCDLENRIALVVEEGARARLQDCAVSGSDIGVLVKGDGAAADLLGVKFRDSERAVSVEGKAKVDIDSSEFALTGQGGGVIAGAGSSVSVRKSKLRLNNLSQVGIFAHASEVKVEGSEISDSLGAGIIAEAGATVRMSRSVISRSRSCGVHVDGAALVLDRATLEHNDCGVGFLGPGTLDANDSVFKGNKTGPVAVKPGEEHRVVIRGARNTGLTAAKAPVKLAKPKPEHKPFKNDIFGRRQP